MTKSNFRDRSKPLFEKYKIMNIFALYLIRLIEFLIKYKDYFSENKIKIVNTRQNANKLKPLPKLLYTKSYQTAYYNILKILNVNLKSMHFNDMNESFLNCFRSEILTFETDTIKSLLK